MRLLCEAEPLSVLACEDWAVCTRRCTSKVSLPNQIEFRCGACVFLQSEKAQRFFSLELEVRKEVGSTETRGLQEEDEFVLNSFFFHILLWRVFFFFFLLHYTISFKRILKAARSFFVVVKFKVCVFFSPQ